MSARHTPKVHVAGFLDRVTACGLTLQWHRLSEGGPRLPAHNGKLIALSRRPDEVTCRSCWRACS